MKIIASFFSFARTCVGILNSPYVTVRSLSVKQVEFTHTLFVIGLTVFYFTFASLIRTGLRNPFLLTMRFNSLMTGALIGYLGMVFLLAIGAKVMKGQAKVSTLVVLWSYTLLPTFIWFFTTSLLYILIPPPRTLSLAGKVYSSVYVVFSMTVLFWKMVLYYFTLRFGLRLDLLRIAVFTLIAAPFVAIYSIAMYRWGIFRIPYL